jgi:hypothetical protein
VRFMPVSYRLTVINSMSDLTDIDTTRQAPDSTLFPGLPAGAETHTGFTNEQSKTANQILSEVKNLMAAHNTKQVTIVRIYNIIIMSIYELNSASAFRLVTPLVVQSPNWTLFSSSLTSPMHP